MWLLGEVCSSTLVAWITDDVSVHRKDWQDLHRGVYLDGWQKVSQSAFLTVHGWLCPPESFTGWLSMKATVSPLPSFTFYGASQTLHHDCFGRWLLYQHTAKWLWMAWADAIYGGQSARTLRLSCWHFHSTYVHVIHTPHQVFSYYNTACYLVHAIGILTEVTVLDWSGVRKSLPVTR